MEPTIEAPYIEMEGRIVFEVLKVIDHRVNASAYFVSNDGEYRNHLGTVWLDEGDTLSIETTWSQLTEEDVGRFKQG